MRTLTNDAWRRQGSSIIFDAEEIQRLLDENAMVSLRTFFSWDRDIPPEAPVPGQTVLICGLETVLDTLTEKEAQEFLMRTVRQLVRKIQHEWTNTGLAFGFSQGSHVFQESNVLEDAVLFLRKDQTHVRISEWLWGGTAEQNLHRIEKDVTNQKQLVGYYVSHLS